MGFALVEDDVARLHAAVGFLRSEVQNLIDKFGELKDETATKIDDLHRETVKEHREVHNIVAATSEAMRNLDRDVREMKPHFEDYRLKAASLNEALELSKDYRERRAEWRGAWKFVIALYVSIGGLITLALGKLFDWLTTLGR